MHNKSNRSYNTDYQIIKLSVRYSPKILLIVYRHHSVILSITKNITWNDMSRIKGKNTKPEMLVLFQSTSVFI